MNIGIGRMLATALVEEGELTTEPAPVPVASSLALPAAPAVAFSPALASSLALPAADWPHCGALTNEDVTEGAPVNWAWLASG